MWLAYKEKNPIKAFFLELILYPITFTIGIILLPIVIIWSIYLKLNQHYLKKKIEVDLAKQGVSVNWDKLLSNREQS